MSPTHQALTTAPYFLFVLILYVADMDVCAIRTFTMFPLIVQYDKFGEI